MHIISFSVEWRVEHKISRYGQDLYLMCTYGNDSSSTGAKRWYGGPDKKMLSINGLPSNPAKYNATVGADGFGLVIKNVTERDLNVSYECSYGFVQYKGILFEADAMNGM